MITSLALPSEADASDAGVSLIIVVAFSFIPCGFLLYLINEKVQKERQLQSLRGISVLTYWLVAFMWDLVRLMSDRLIDSTLRYGVV